MDGKVNFFNKKNNFGFITGDDGVDYFVHASGLRASVKIEKNDLVTFQITNGDKGVKAINVEKRK